MDLKHLTDTKCPTCGAPVIKEWVETSFTPKEICVHCNGQRWECREFLCGLRLHWIPNFRRTEIRGECRNSEKYKDQEKRRAVFEAALKQYVNKKGKTLGLTEDELTEVKRCFHKIWW